MDSARKESKLIPCADTFIDTQYQKGDLDIELEYYCLPSSRQEVTTLTWQWCSFA